MWVDSDAYFYEDSPPLEYLIYNYDNNKNEYETILSYSKLNILSENYKSYDINNGVFLFKNCENNIKILNRILNSGDIKEVAEKLHIIYDQAIFENKLPYSSYLDKIKQDKFILEKRIDKKADLPLSLEYQSLQLRMETIAFYKLFLVFLLIFNFIFYKTYLYRTKLRVLFFKESDKEDKRLEIPSILNIVFLNNKERTITFWIIVLQIIISGIVLWINFSYLNIIYNSIMFFLLWCILPFSLIIVLWIKQVNKCNKLISGSSLNQYP